jgi:hypothetical protein
MHLAVAADPRGLAIVAPAVVMVDFAVGIAEIEACAREPLPSASFATVAFS